jgi:hypothetical protein
MTDERGIGPLPVTPTAGSANNPALGGLLGIRAAGAVLGAILAAAAVFVAVRVDAFLVARPEDSPIAVVFGPNGIAGGDPLATVLVWAVGPVAAAVAGWLFASLAVRSVDGAGLWMGAATYVLAIGLAPLSLIPGAASQGLDAVRNVAAVPFLWMFAGAALGPLLGVCLIAGPVWATVLRRTVGGASGATSARTLPLWPIVLMAVAVFLGFVVVVALLGSLDNMGGGFID